MAGSLVAPSENPPVASYRLPSHDEQAPASESASAQDAALEESLLLQHAQWFCRLRWLVVAVLAAMGVAGLCPEPLSRLGLALSPTWPFATAAILALFNGIFVALPRQDGSPACGRRAPTQSFGVTGAGTDGGAASAAGRGRPWPARFQLWLQIIADLLILTAVIHCLGSLETCAPFMYLFHVILACIFFTPAESLAVSILAIGLYVGCLLLEFTGVLPPQTILASPGLQVRSLLTHQFLVLQAASVAAIWAVIWFLVSRLAGTLRCHERELADTNRRLAASSVERAEHMLQTTHQLKAPFAAIHANTQLLLGGFCGELPPPARGIVEKISARSAALSQQIQEMLQLANLRSEGQVPPDRTDVDLAALLDAAIAHLEPAARPRSICFRKELVPVTVHAVPDHLRMLVDNLLLNAVNYSHPGGEVSVDCRPSDHDAAMVVIGDHGIGIPEEKLPRIFEDYYRTDEAARHNRASTGLGLAIVRHVARKMNVTVQVESAPQWGTRFLLTIPRAAPVSRPASRGRGK
jgi:signal transduction histidine kinase